MLELGMTFYTFDVELFYGVDIKQKVKKNDENMVEKLNMHYLMKSIPKSLMPPAQ